MVMVAVDHGRSFYFEDYSATYNKDCVYDRGPYYEDCYSS